MARLLAAGEQLARMGSWELDLRSGETLWSDGIYGILGIPPSDVAQPFGTVLRYVHQDDRERMERMLADAVERPEAVPVAGSSTWFLADPRARDGAAFRRNPLKIRRTAGNACAASGRCSSHEARRLMLLTALTDLGGLDDAPKVADTILGLMPDTGVMIVDLEMRIVLMRGGVYERHGYDAESAVGRYLRDVVPPATLARLTAHWSAALAGETLAVDLESSDGQADYWVHFGPLRTEAGVVGAIMVSQDISERIRVREEIRRWLTQ